MDAADRTQRISVGVFWLLVLLVAAYVAPRFVGALLMLFSLLVFVLAVVGLAWPSLMRLPNRLAAVWVFALSVGMFVGGGMLMAPQNGESTASDVPAVATRQSMPDPETPEEREARIGGRLERFRRPTTSNQRPPAAVRQSPTSRQRSTDTGSSMDDVYAETWSDGPWPLTIDMGVLSCVEVDGAGPAAVIADGDGTVWALNGIARAYVPLVGGQANISPIWRDDPGFPGLGIKTDLSPMIERALRLC